MVEAPHSMRNSAQAVKTDAAFSLVNSPPQRPRLQKIRLLQADGASRVGRTPGLAFRRANRGNLLRQTHFHQVPGLAPLEQAQSAMLHKPAHRLSHSIKTEANTSGEPLDRKPQSDLPFQSAMPHQAPIDHAVHSGEVQLRGEQVLALFPDLYGVGFLSFHGLNPGRKCRLGAAET
jgi:hypothetical protein